MTTILATILIILGIILFWENGFKANFIINQNKFITTMKSSKTSLALLGALMIFVGVLLLT